MAELAPRERLQPCLLDRLADDEPGNREESRDRRVISLRRYRDAVLRDLAWLLNTPAHTADEGFAEFPEVEKSVLNFGVRDVCGMSISGLTAQEMEQKLLQAIRLFEPRVMRNSLSFTSTSDPGRLDRTAVTFEIRGQLWAQPAPEALFIKTEFDLETGECELESGGHG
ncbi:MAG: type VI secretion system baseplate subunit TssE [Kiritimatiellae bacterium]|nr:type VI secretion system baseplate subunit TssE [Kiritimatiellia bacterium]